MAVMLASEMLGDRGQIAGRTSDRERRWRVQLDSPVNGGSIAMTADDGVNPRVPSYGDAHPRNSLVRVRSVSIEDVSDNGCTYTVLVRYDNSPSPRDQSDNPLQQTPEVRWSFVKSQEVVSKAKEIRVGANGQQVVAATFSPIANSAGDPFDPPQTVDVTDTVLTVVRNEPTFDYQIARNWQDAINTDVFYGAAAGQARLTGMSADLVHTDALDYARVTYEITIRERGWDLFVADVGYRRLDTILGVATQNLAKIPIYDDDGNKLEQPWPLDGFGQRLSAQQVQQTGLVYLRWRIYHNLRQFSQLGL